MGKATIIPGGNPSIGYYKIRLDIDRAKADAQILKTTRHIETLDTDIIPVLSSARMDAQNDWAHSGFVLDEIIKQRYAGGTENPDERLEAATIDEKAAYGRYIEAKAKYDAAIFKRESLRRKITYLEGRLERDEVYAWCADCTKHLQGDVGTMEIPGTTEEILIRPGGASGVDAYYNASRDGQLTHVASMSTAEAMYAFTMFPGWQKWRPTYRIGTILSIFGDGKYAFVELDEYYSDVQDLDINVETSYAKVILRYKGQGRPGAIHGAYRRGMRVVLEYENQDHTKAPEVIGLEQSPCTTTSTTMTTTSVSTISTTTSSLLTTTTTATTSTTATTATQPPSPTEWKSPVTCRSAPWGLSIAPWVNPENARNSDDIRTSASFTTTGYSQRLNCYRFRFLESDIPPGSTIEGVEVQIEKSANVPNQIRDSLVRLTDQTGDVGDNKASPTLWSTTEAYVTYGGATDDWNANLTDSDVRRAAFGVRVIVFNTVPGACSALIDHVRIRIYWS